MQWLSGSRPSAMWQARLVELWCVGKRSGWSVSKDYWLPFLFLEDFFAQGACVWCLDLLLAPFSTRRK
jgi:hypothetical protein